MCFNVKIFYAEVQGTFLCTVSIIRLNNKLLIRFNRSNSERDGDRNTDKQTEGKIYIYITDRGERDVSEMPSFVKAC